MSYLKTAILSALVLILGVTLSAHAAGLRVGDQLPDLESFDLEGSLPSVEGKVVLIDFWASWCGPCKASFPALDDIQKKYKGAGFELIGVSVDEKKAQMDEFLDDHPVSFTIVRDGQHKLVAAAQVKTMPTSLIVDREGVIRFVHSGYRGDETKEKLETEIRSLLE